MLSYTEEKSFKSQWLHTGKKYWSHFVVAGPFPHREDSDDSSEHLQGRVRPDVGNLTATPLDLYLNSLLCPLKINL
jgi:hypothetical protein